MGAGLRGLLGLWAGKLAIAASRTLGRGGSSFPGRLARRIAPSLTAWLARRQRAGIMAVTGTNGKTTTARMLAAILGRAGYRVTHNRSGANLPGGVTAALVDAAPWLPRNELPGGVGLLEVDEAALPRLAGELRPRVVVVTNFFRDQLDRYGELVHTVELVRRGLAEAWPAAVPGAGAGAVLENAAAVADVAVAPTAVLNADDPLVSWLGEGHGGQALYFGVADPSLGGADRSRAADARHCVRCGYPYEYTAVFYSHLGHYRCPDCGLTRPDPAVVLERAEPEREGFRVRIGTPRGAIEALVPVSGLYNLYNALAATAAAYAFGVPLEAVAQGLESYTASFGRMETLPVRGRDIVVALVKNPAGFNQVLDAWLAAPERPRRLLIAINDLAADGTDVSWLWDVDCERLGAAADESGWIGCAGIRAEEMALRLKYAGVPAARTWVENDLGAALDRALAATPAGQRLWICPTYTALLELRRLLHRRGEARGFWEV